MNPPLLRSSLGLAYMVVGLILTGSLVGVFFELFSLIQTPLQFLGDMLLIPLGLLMAWLLITWLTLRVYLYPDYLETRSLWGTRRLEWRYVATLRSALPATPYLLNLRNLKTGGLQMLSLFAFHNRRDLIQGIIDLSWRNNSSVRLDDSLTARYGYPPYGRKYQKESEEPSPSAEN
jgi:hypothetical protein